MAPGHAFRWVKPEVYPIIFPVALALGAMTYSMGRHLWTNPEVFPNKKLRSEGVPEEETNRFRAEGYSKSIFRTLQEVGQSYQIRMLVSLTLLQGQGIKGIFGGSGQDH